MALKDLTAGDFNWLQQKAHAMLAVHEKEFVKQIDPKLMRCMYRGRTKYEDRDNEVYGREQQDDKHLTALITIFQSENTIIPTLYPANPTPIVKPGRGSDGNSAALMTAIIKHYMRLNNAKVENQEAVLNSRFFGLGWKKLGWQSVYETVAEGPEDIDDEPKGFLDKAKQFMQGMLGGGPGMKPDHLEYRETAQIPYFEMLFNVSESPMNVALDDKSDFLNRKAILHSLPRTLYDLQNSGDYDDPEGAAVLEELQEQLRNKMCSRFDSRNTELHLRELHIQQRNGIWIATWVDEMSKCLKYRKSDFKGKGFLFEPLSLTFEPGCRYPTSHIKVASQLQTKLDDLTSKFVEIAARSVNLTVVNPKAFQYGSESVLEKNLIRGILKTKNGAITPGDIQSFASSSGGQDLPQLIEVLQRKIGEILGADQQLVSGDSKNDTLGQDELARTGTKLREGGMKDRVRDWMISQLQKESVLIKQYSNSELHVKITGKDYADPMTGEKMEDRWASFMTPENPLGARHYLQGEFEHEFNMDDVARPAKETIREAMMTYLKLDADPAAQDANLQAGFRVRRDKINLEIMKTYDNVVNPEEFIERLDSKQVAAIQTQKVLMQSGGMAPQTKMRADNETKIATAKEKKQNPESEVTNQSSVEANR